MNTIEYVARAIWESEKPFKWEDLPDDLKLDYIRMSRAAIKALLEEMWEPSETMDRLGKRTTKETWQALLEQFEKELEG